MSGWETCEMHRSRAAMERIMASRATCAKAELAHRNLAAMHERAADRSMKDPAALG